MEVMMKKYLKGNRKNIKIENKIYENCWLLKNLEQKILRTTF
jgi:hypothetical protein